jgi:IS605 OrfB family transposase
MAKVRTYQTRISLTPEQDALLSAYAALYGRVERTLFARLRAGEQINDLKRNFQLRFGITARQFNAIHAGLNGKISSIKERQDGLISEMTGRIARARKAIGKLQKEDASSHKHKLHQKKRRLATLQSRLARLQEDKDTGQVRLCFGSKKLFRAQFQLQESGYSSHAEWLTDWRRRDSQFFVIGSKDETMGCQGCLATVAEDGTITLRLRLPNSSSAKYTVITSLRFGYGHEAILAAIGRNLSDNRSDWQAINYRFVRDDKGWRVFITVSLPEVKVISDRRLGVIGMDINADRLAVTETDRYGNPVAYFSVPCVTYGKTAEQRRAVIGEAVKQAVAFAVQKQKPLVMEKLDFQKKKATLEGESPGYSRMLSALAYNQIQAILRARAFDAGIQVFEVNPAYTSVIGQHKFARRYGISVHNAAALVMGRRFQGFSESLPLQLRSTLSLSVRNRGRHVWSRWAAFSRKTKAALAAYRQPRKGSSPSPALRQAQGKARPGTRLSVAGETPAGESSAKLFG